MISRLVLLAALAGGPWAACQASALRFCDQPATLNAEQKDELFRFGAIVKGALENSGQGVALIARSGLDLSRFDVRYSHAGLSLQSGLDTPWAVRQLYYACDEQRPRIYDQGMTGFLLGLNDPAIGYVSVVFLPADAGAALARVAGDKRQVLQALAPVYSANAYPFSLRYQNCNQWVAEMLATAWGDPVDGEDLRAQAQHWLQAQGYEPTVFDVGYRPHLWIAAGFVPWLHQDDHPREDLDRMRLRVSTPASIEAFVQATVPGAQRMEFCHAGRRVVIRHGWDLIPEGCQPGEHDQVVMLD